MSLENNYFIKKHWSELQKNTWKYNFTPVYQKSWHDLQLLRYRKWKTATPTPLTKKSEFWKNEKKNARDIIVYQKLQSYEVG